MKKKHLFLVAIFLLFIIVLSYKRGYFNKPKIIALKIIMPIEITANNFVVSTRGFILKIINIKNLQKENAELKKELDNKEAQIAALLEAKKENDSLRKDLGFKINSGFETLAATVIMYDPIATKQLIIVNKGEKDGVKKGMAVVSEGALVGKVVETENEFSKILLITDLSSAVPVLIQNSTITGIVKGQIGYGLHLEKVPQDDPLKQGQVVVSSGLGGDYPKGIIIGKIDKVEKSSDAIFQEASIRPEVNFKMLERVLIIIR